MLTSYLVLDLPFETDEEAFLDQFLEAARAIGRSDSEFVADQREKTPTQTLTRFLNQRGDATISVWEDRVARLRYLEFSMPNESRMKKALSAFRKRFKTIDHEDVVARIAGARDEEDLPANIFYQLAYSAPNEVVEATTTTIEAALTSRIDARRQGAAAAVGVLGWRDLEAPLRTALASERDDATRQAMENALKVFT